MARTRNTMKLINESIGKINARYDIVIGDIMDIYDASRNNFDLICNGFRFGYLQGMKAAKSEMKKAEGTYEKKSKMLCRQSSNEKGCVMNG